MNDPRNPSRANSIPVSLDEFERKLRANTAQARSQPIPPHTGHSREPEMDPQMDPLAELARLVGGEDPFEAMVKGERPASKARQNFGEGSPLVGEMPMRSDKRMDAHPTPRADMRAGARPNFHPNVPQGMEADTNRREGLARPQNAGQGARPLSGNAPEAGGNFAPDSYLSAANPPPLFIQNRVAAGAKNPAFGGQTPNTFGPMASPQSRVDGDFGADMRPLAQRTVQSQRGSGLGIEPGGPASGRQASQSLRREDAFGAGGSGRPQAPLTATRPADLAGPYGFEGTHALPGRPFGQNAFGQNAFGDEGGQEGLHPHHGFGSARNDPHGSYALPDAHGQDGSYAEQDEGEGYDAFQQGLGALAQEPPRASKKTLIVVGALALVLAFGGAGTYYAYKAFRGNPQTVGVIAAPKAPVKIPAPPAASGDQPSDVASVPPSGSGKLVSQTEDPDDLKTRQSKPSGPDNGAASGGLSSNLSDFPTPKRVKTYTVRQDGSIVGAPSQASGASGSQTGSGTPAPAASVPPDAAARASKPAQAPVSGTAPDAAEGVDKARQRAPLATNPASAANARQTAAAAPLPPGEPLQLVPGGAASNGPLTAARQPSPINAPVVTNQVGGGYALQCSATSSEQEAKDTLARLQQKYAPGLGDNRLAIYKAIVNGRSIYRIRVANLSKEAADSLKSNTDANGGTCFITSN